MSPSEADPARRRPCVRLVGPAYTVGSPVPISDVLPGDVSGELAARLRGNGFAHCAVSDRSATALAAQAVAELLRHVDASARIDAVVYGTGSFGRDLDPRGGLEAAVREQVLRPTGLEHLPVYGVWLADSGNLASVVRLAHALIRDGRARTVLCVVADKVPDGPGEYREMPYAITINGDGAAACLLSTVLAGDYTVEGVVQVSAPTITVHSREQRGLRKHLQVIAGVRSCADRLYAVTGRQPGDYRWLIANNYAHRSLGEFADMARLPQHALHLATIARHAHIFTADGLINLADLSRSVDIPVGERILMLSSGPLTWGAIGLIRTGPADRTGTPADPAGSGPVVTATRVGDAGADPVTVAAAAVADVLAAADVDAGTVPLVVVGTPAPGLGTSAENTPLLNGDLSHDVVSRVVTGNGLTAAVPFGIAVAHERLAAATGDCAEALMAADGLDTAVVVTVSAPGRDDRPCAEASVLGRSPAPQRTGARLEGVVN